MQQEGSRKPSYLEREHVYPTGQKNRALQVPPVVPCKALGKSPKALHGTTGGTCSAPSNEIFLFAFFYSSQRYGGTNIYDTVMISFFYYIDTTLLLGFLPLRKSIYFHM